MPLITPDSDWTRITELPDLRRVPRMARDRETRDDGLSAGRGPGWAFRAGHTVGLSVAWDGGSFYAPTRHPDSDNFDPDQVAQWERDHQHVPTLFHNAGYDVGWGVAEGVPPPDHIGDTMAQAVFADENRLSYQLDDLCRWRGVPGKDTRALREAAVAYGFAPSKLKANLWRMPARYVGPYAEADAVALLGLSDSLTPLLREEETFDAYRLEMDLVPMVCEMRRRGIRVDLEAAERGKVTCYTKRDAAFRELSDKLGTRVGMEEIGKTSWLEKAFDAQGIPYPRTEKTGVGSFTAGTTGWMQKHPHWLPKLIVQADQYHNIASKFLQGFILDYSHRGRLHANINQYLGEDEDGVRRGTITFRFSYSDPALQQMPNRIEELAALVRGCFLPNEGEVWCTLDYSQQEYRLIVHFAVILGCTKAEVAAEKYRRDPKTDYHSMVAELTGLERKPAKDTNFAKSYGAGIPKFASMINQSEDAARAIMEQYDREMPFVKELSERLQKLGQRRGYIKLLDGARAHFSQWELAWREYGSPYQPPANSEAEAHARWPGKRVKRAFTKDAMNRLIQGSAARQTKMAMLSCWREGYCPLLQMHDELDFSLAEETGEADGKRLSELMRDVVQLEVPMAVDAEYGMNWGKAKNDWAGRHA